MSLNSLTTVGICDIKNAHLFICFSFHAIHLKFCNNIEPFQKTYVFLFFRFWHFWPENDVTKFPPNFVFSIIGYLMMVSERTHHKDVKSEKIKICLSPQKI